MMGTDSSSSFVRRFYSNATVEVRDAEYAVLLDGREIKTPGKRNARVSVKTLADEIANEWAAQEDSIVPTTMPMTQLAFTAIDRVAPNRAEIEEAIAKYIESDLVSHRVETPEDLAQRQTEEWQPFVDWFESQYEVTITVTTSLLSDDGNEQAIAVIRALLENLDDLELAAVSVMTQTMGSVVLALAVLQGSADAAEVAEASQLDERYQREKWGQDREDMARLKSLTDDVVAAARFLSLHRSI